MLIQLQELSAVSIGQISMISNRVIRIWITIMNIKTLRHVKLWAAILNR